MYQYLILNLPYFHASNSVLFLPSTLVLSLSIDVMLTLNVGINSDTVSLINWQIKFHAMSKKIVIFNCYSKYATYNLMVGRWVDRWVDRTFRYWQYYIHGNDWLYIYSYLISPCQTVDILQKTFLKVFCWMSRLKYLRIYWEVFRITQLTLPTFFKIKVWWLQPKTVIILIRID